jgi:hypothetical protein
MSNSKMFLASIDLDKIDKSKIKTFTRKDGTIGKSIDIVGFISEEADQFGKNVAIAQSKEKDSTEKTNYIGRGLGKVFLGTPTQTTGDPVSNAPTDDLPF